MVKAQGGQKVQEFGLLPSDEAEAFVQPGWSVPGPELHHCYACNSLSLLPTSLGASIERYNNEAWHEDCFKISDSNPYSGVELRP